MGSPSGGAHTCSLTLFHSPVCQGAKLLWGRCQEPLGLAGLCPHLICAPSQAASPPCTSLPTS